MDIELPFITDTIHNGDGFYFNGKIFGTNQNEKILVDLSSNTSLIEAVSTNCKKFRTMDGISVGSSLSELVKKVPELFHITDIYENDNEFFTEKFENSWIIYSIDYKTRVLLAESGLYSGEIDEKVTVNKKFVEYIHQLGDRAKIVEIKVVDRNNCKKI